MGMHLEGGVQALASGLSEPILFTELWASVVGAGSGGKQVL